MYVDDHPSWNLTAALRASAGSFFMPVVSDTFYGFSSSPDILWKYHASV